MSRPLLVGALALALFAAACGGAPVARPTPAPAAEGDRATPMATLTGAVALTEAQLRQELDEAGFTLESGVGDYRPAEPAELQAAPRAVMRIGLADRRSGWLLIYDLGSAGAAETAGRAFADYLASNFGQASYPPDARFLLNRFGATLLFGWWSASRTVQPDQAQAAFDALREVGEPISVR